MSQERQRLPVLATGRLRVVPRVAGQGAFPNIAFDWRIQPDNAQAPVRINTNGDGFQFQPSFERLQFASAFYPTYPSFAFSTDGLWRRASTPKNTAPNAAAPRIKLQDGGELKVDIGSLAKRQCSSA